MSKETRYRIKGRVLHFDENLGRGVIRLETGERVKVTHHQIAGEGFKVLFEGETVIIKGKRVFPLRELKV